MFEVVPQRKPKQDPFSRALSQRLRELREQRGWIQKDLADRVGILREVVANYERGVSHPPLPTLQKLARVFGVTIDYLINGDPPPRAEFQDRELLDFVAKIDKLDFRLRDALKEMMLALLARHEMDEKKSGRKERVA